MPAVNKHLPTSICPTNANSGFGAGRLLGPFHFRSDGKLGISNQGLLFGITCKMHADFLFLFCTCTHTHNIRTHTHTHTHGRAQGAANSATTTSTP